MTNSLRHNAARPPSPIKSSMHAAHHQSSPAAAAASGTKPRNSLGILLAKPSLISAAISIDIRTPPPLPAAHSKVAGCCLALSAPSTSVTAGPRTSTSPAAPMAASGDRGGRCPDAFFRWLVFITGARRLCDWCANFAVSHCALPGTHSAGLVLLRLGHYGD